MDTLEQIRIFVLAVRTGSFSEAGRQMDLSPATVSRYIQSLEERFASRLLNRSSRGLSLTHAGEVLIERATRVLQEFDEIEPAVTDLSKSPQGRLHVHAREFVGHHLIVPFVGHFLESHPAIEVVLTLADRPIDLIENNIDISIRTERSGEIEHLSLVTRKLGSWPRVVVASPGYLRRHGTPTIPVELEQHDCLTYQFHQAAPIWQFRRGSEHEQVKVRTKVQSSSGESLRQLALSGHGLTMMPQWSVIADIAAGRLVALFEGHDIAPIDAPFQHNIFAVYQPARHQSPKLKTFLQSLVRSMSTATLRKRAGDL